MPERSWIDDFIEQIEKHLQGGGTPVGNTSENLAALKEMYSNGDYAGIQGLGIAKTPEQEKWLDNMIANQRTEEARAFETQSAKESILNTASQLEQLGLSASGVLNVGGSQANGVAAAENVKTNVAQQKYAQRMALAKQLLGMTSQMASAGVYGHAIGAAKKASSTMAALASNSALDAIQEPPNKYSGLSHAELIRLLKEDD